MERRLIKSQTLYSLYSYYCMILCIIVALIGFCLQKPFLYILIIFILIISLLMQYNYTHQLKKKLLLLIKMSQNILDQKKISLPIIDGESYLAILYHHLSLLDQRMKGYIEQLQQEKINLQKYIEDISHQIKTPLTSMLLKEDILLMKCPHQKEDIEQLIHQTQSIDDLIESLLHLASLDADRIQYHQDEYTLQEIIDTIEDNLQPLLENADVSLLLHHSSLLYCDFQWMKEAFENIIKNCIEQKHHSTIDITCIDYPTYIEIHIQDHGPGFTKEDLPHLFERFYHSQFSHNGHGIGLAMSQKIIEDHHGSLQALNHDGALFIITLPHKMTKSKYDSHEAVR